MTAKRKFRSFEEALAYVHTLKLTGQSQYLAHIRSGQSPGDIPTEPQNTYKDQWQSWGHWCGTGFVANRLRKYRSFEKALEYVHSLKLTGQSEWRTHSKSGQLPEDIPSAPNKTYKDQWQSWGHWFGTGIVSTNLRKYRSFEEALEYVHSLKLKGTKEWSTHSKSGQLPEDIPSVPSRTYKNQWQSWGHWCGTGFVANHLRKYRSFEEALEYVHSLKLKGIKEWKDYIKLGQLPEDIPSNADVTYKNQWQSWGHWLGHHKRWTKKAVVNFVKSLLPVIDKLDRSELFSIIINSNLMAAYQSLAEDSLIKNILMSTLDGNKDKVEELLEGNNFVESSEDMEENIALAKEQEFHETITDYSNIEEDDNELPNITIKEILNNIDYLDIEGHLSDTDTVNFLVNKSMGKMWHKILQKDDHQDEIDQLNKYSGKNYSSIIAKKFLKEYEGAQRLITPDGYNFKINNKLTPPNLMQRLISYKVKEEKRIGNWSGTGSGKTLGAILASETIQSKLTIIVALNNTILYDDSGWPLEIKSSFPNSLIHKKVRSNFNFNANKSNYVLLNYELFQLNSSKKMIDDLISNNIIDMIILDEIHFVKQRDDTVTKRRQLLNYLITEAANKNPDIAVLGMSATPVINSLDESVSLIEMVTGEDYSDIDVSPKISNALIVHQHLTINGIRYIPNYDMSLNQQIIKKEDNSLISDIKNNSSGIAELEKILLQSKLEMIEPLLKPGAIIYSHYVTGIFSVLKRFIESKGYKVGVFNGEDKTGLKNFKDGKVDILIGSSALGTGVDGLQYVSNRMIIITLPWTSAAYDQLIGRIYRQGSAFKSMDIFIPQLFLNDDNFRWSWDEQRYSRIMYKKTLSDTAVDGIIPEGNIINPAEMFKTAKKSLLEWIERLEVDGIKEIERDKLKLPLPPDIIQSSLMRYGDFSKMNARMNSSNSSTTFERFKEDPREWYLYHSLYQESRKIWDEVPYEVMANSLAKRPDLVIGDFGCGEANLSKLIKNKVWSFDFIAIDESVMACDMASINLENEIIDVAIFSLSLMGKNWEDYIKEAFRLTKVGGLLKIAEPKNRWANEKLINLTESIKKSGYSIQGDIEYSSKFIYINATKPL